VTVLRAPAGVFIAGVGEPATMSFMPLSVFDEAASHYDAARPSYPAALFDELEARTGSLAGQLVLDWGAGTGIASRQLAERGGTVVLLDIGEQMLRRALARRPRSACVLADGNHMPVRPASVDITTFAQSWHWFDQELATAEAARVLRPGGFWAAWWNRAHADGEAWFDDYQHLVSSSCPGYNWQHLSDDQMTPDWTSALVVTMVPWVRHVTAEHWITDERSKSYFIELEPARRESVLAQVAALLNRQFPDGQLVVPYITTLLLARKDG